MELSVVFGLLWIIIGLFSSSRISRFHRSPDELREYHLDLVYF